MLQGAIKQARQVGDRLRRHQVEIRQTLHEDFERNARFQTYERRLESGPSGAAGRHRYRAH
jgi:hypothetical protein